jgi:hypothetical protein
METNYKKKFYLNNCEGKIWCDGYLKFLIASVWDLQDFEYEVIQG